MVFGVSFYFIANYSIEFSTLTFSLKKQNFRFFCDRGFAFCGEESDSTKLNLWCIPFRQHSYTYSRTVMFPFFIDL